MRSAPSRASGPGPEISSAPAAAPLSVPAPTSVAAFGSASAAGERHQVESPRLASRLDHVADDLDRRGRESRLGFAPVVWDGEARAALDAHLARLDTELAGIVAEIRRCAASLRGSGTTAP